MNPHVHLPQVVNLYVCPGCGLLLVKVPRRTKEGEVVFSWEVLASKELRVDV